MAEFDITTTNNAVNFDNIIANPTLRGLSFEGANFLPSLYSVIYYLTISACLVAFIIATLLYISSSGDPGKIKKARSYVEAGITSLVVVVGGRFFFALLSKIQGSGDPATTSAQLFGFLSDTMGDVLVLGYEIGFVLVALFIAWGGITYLFSAGDPGKVKKAVSTITAALLGLVILILFYALSSFILNFTMYNDYRNSAENPAVLEGLQIKSPPAAGTGSGTGSGSGGTTNPSTNPSAPGTTGAMQQQIINNGQTPAQSNSSGLPCIGVSCLINGTTGTPTYVPSQPSTTFGPPPGP